MPLSLQRESASGGPGVLWGMDEADEGDDEGQAQITDDLAPSLSSSFREKVQEQRRAQSFLWTSEIGATPPNQPIGAEANLPEASASILSAQLPCSRKGISN